MTYYWATIGYLGYSFSLAAFEEEAPNPSGWSWHFWRIRTRTVTVCTLYLSLFNYIHVCDCITFSIKGPTLALSHQSGWRRTQGEKDERPVYVFNVNLPWCEVDENKQSYSLEGLVLLWVKEVACVESKCWARFGRNVCRVDTYRRQSTSLI